MFTETIDAIRHRQDFLRSIREPQPPSTFAEGEVRIRAELREMVKGEMKYLTKANAAQARRKRRS